MFFRVQSKHGLLQWVLGQFACIVNFSLGLLFYFPFFKIYTLMQNKVNVGSLYMDLKRGDKTGGITSSY